jgi:hypothetical protein
MILQNLLQEKNLFSILQVNFNKQDFFIKTMFIVRFLNKQNFH